MFKNEEQDAITREKQDREYKEKKAKQQAEMERIAREEAQKDAEAGAPTASAPQLVTNIQDPPIAMAPSADADAGKLIDTGSRQWRSEGRSYGTNMREITFMEIAFEQQQQFYGSMEMCSNFTSILPTTLICNAI